MTIYLFIEPFIECYQTENKLIMHIVIVTVMLFMAVFVAISVLLFKIEKLETLAEKQNINNQQPCIECKHSSEDIKVYPCDVCAGHNLWEKR